MTTGTPTDRQASRAIALWGADPASLDLIMARENAVYAVQLTGGGRAVLRLHRPFYHGPDALLSELAWMEHLALSGLTVPAPIRSLSGALFETLPAESDLPGQLVDMLDFMPGSPMGRSSAPFSQSPEDLVAIHHALGKSLARLHRISDAWTLPNGFVRPRWDLDGLLGEAPFWGRFWDWPGLLPDDRHRLSAFRDHARDRLETIGGSLDVGLIHADPVRENVLLADGQPIVIDFDDAGFGYRLFDLATALVKSRTEPQYEGLRDALVDGYRSITPLSDHELAELDLFLALRAASYIGWGAARIGEPGMAERMKRFVTETAGWMARIGF